jgi:predicted phosphoribosyltransferase
LIFEDRQHAGRLLAETLATMNIGDPVVLAIPRGGVVVAYEVVKRLGCSMDVIIPRKIGAPFQPELAVGAVTEDGTIYVNKDIVAAIGVSESYLESEAQNQLREIKRRAQVYRKGAQPTAVSGKTAILVDDGVATGATMKAAILSLKKYSPKKIIIAVPVGAKETIDEFRKQVDEIVCLHIPESMYAIGEFYRNFEQTTDQEVVSFLESAD